MPPCTDGSAHRLADSWLLVDCRWGWDETGTGVGVGGSMVGHLGGAGGDGIARFWVDNVCENTHILNYEQSL